MSTRVKLPESLDKLLRSQLEEAITAAISINGEALTASTATVTPAAVENFFNIYVSAVVDVPRGCCVTVAAKNTSTQPILVANSNFIVERVA